MTKPSLFKLSGTGIGLRPVYYDQFQEKIPSPVSWVEVISENYMPWKDGLVPEKPLRYLESIRRNVPLALHGVSMSLGSSGPINQIYLKRLSYLIKRLEPTCVSDHLCFNGVNGQNLHDLLPLPYTEESIKNVAARIAQTQEILGRRILIENVSSYIEYEASEMPEWEFLSEVANQADCGILLDINNVFVSGFNHKFDPKIYLKNIPHHRVGQIHLAGHSDNGSFLVDTHDEPVRPEVWDLFSWYATHFNVPAAMIERDDNFPEWSELHSELLKMHNHMSIGKGAEFGKQSEVLATTIF